MYLLLQSCCSVLGGVSGLSPPRSQESGVPFRRLWLSSGESLIPLQPSGRFGSALAVLDFNKDGVPDLAVGAPSVGSEQLTYKVRVLLVGLGEWDGSQHCTEQSICGEMLLGIRSLMQPCVAWQHLVLVPQILTLPPPTPTPSMMLNGSEGRQKVQPVQSFLSSQHTGDFPACFLSCREPNLFPIFLPRAGILAQQGSLPTCTQCRTQLLHPSIALYLL